MKEKRLKFKEELNTSMRLTKDLRRWNYKTKMSLSLSI